MHKKDMKQSETPLTHKRCLKLRVISIVFRRHSKCPIGIFSSKIFSYKVYLDKYLYVYSSQNANVKKKFFDFPIHEYVWLWFVAETVVIYATYHCNTTRLSPPPHPFSSDHFNSRKYEKKDETDFEISPDIVSLYQLY